MLIPREIHVNPKKKDEAPKNDEPPKKTETPKQSKSEKEESGKPWEESHNKYFVVVVFK